jgi:quercetin dioxygenase-like cupin family protein
MAVELDVGHAIHLRAGGGVGSTEPQESGGASFAGAGAGEAEVIRDAPESRLEILSGCDELHATWTRFGPHRDGASPHVHREHCDLFYVLDGELTLIVGPDQAERALGPGTLALAPPLVVHGFRNASDGELRYLNFHAPGGGFAPYLRGEQPGFDSFDPPADGGRPLEDAYIGTGEALSSDRPGLRVALLCDVDEIAIVDVTSVPGGGAPTPPLHVHERHVESFYVLEGELAFTAGGEELRAAAGSWVQVPPNVPHSFAPTGSEPARYVNVHTPSRGFGTFTRALLTARTDDELAAARAAFDQKPV